MVASPLDLGSDRAKITITSLAHNKSVSFIPYNFTFDDNFKPEWNSYDAFGKMDPVMIYKRTSREINISFDAVSQMNVQDVVSESQLARMQNNRVPEISMVSENQFEQLQRLIQFLYPVYSQPLNSVGDIGSMQEKLNEKRNQLSYTEEMLSQMSTEDQETRNLINQLGQEVIQAENVITQAQATAEENRTIQDYGINIIQKSPLFVIKFLNLINNSQYVCAVTNFKHKLFFDEGSTNNLITADGQFIPGKFNISLGFKVMHNYLPGTKLNY